MKTPYWEQVRPGADGIVAIRHGLGTERVRVRCRDSNGMVIGYRLHNPISAHEVEVATVPGSDVRLVEVVAEPPAEIGDHQD